MALTFQHKGLAALLADAQASWVKGVRPLHGENSEPGFWLVGDEGVYLMHNGEGWEAGKQVYADESNPTAQEFDEWWHGKQENFGGDDGVDFLPAAIIINAVEAGAYIRIDVLENDAFNIQALLPKGGRQ